MPAAPSALPPVLVRRLPGLTGYEASVVAMREFTGARGPDTPDELWLLQHPPVYTLGLNTNPAHLLSAGNIPVVQTDRGGQVTYHGPGQLVAYPLLDLQRAGLGIRQVVSALEDAVIALAAGHGIQASARREAPGVYVAGSKLASVGLRVRRGCTYHGLAVNVDMDLAPFGGINPCGYPGLQVTSLALLGGPTDLDAVAAELAAILLGKLNMVGVGAPTLQFRVEGFQALGSAHVRPPAPVLLAGHLAAGRSGPEQRGQREPARARSGKESRIDHGYAGKGPVSRGANAGCRWRGFDPATGQQEVAARVVRRIGHQHEMRQRARGQAPQAEAEIAGDVAVHDPEGPGSQQRQGVMNAAAGFERLGPLLAEREGHAIPLTVAEIAAELLPVPGKVDHQLTDPGTGERLDVIVDQGLATRRQKRLRQIIGEGPHPLAAAGRQYQGAHRAHGKANWKETGGRYTSPGRGTANPGGLLRGSLLILLLWTAAASGAETAPPEVFGCPIPAPPELAMPGSSDTATIPGLSGDTEVSADLGQQAIDIVTGDVEIDLNGPAVFNDRLVMRQGARQLGADSGRFDRGTGEFAAEGNVEFRDPNTWVRGDAARYNSTTGLFSIERAEYDLFSVPARGSADRMAVEETRKLTLTNVTYTTCASGKDDWLLRAGSLSLDRDTGTGTARNARLEFKGVPILYAPYLTYPIDNRRKSGLLLPDVGNSDQRGIEFEMPYYFNLAPNYDATLTPHYMSRRGLQAKGEFRYLSGGTSGALNGEFLPNDDVTDENRGLISWFNQSQLPAGWRGTVDATDVSDTAYYEDLSSGLANTSQTHVRRRVDLELFNQTWYSLLRVEDYETLDEAILPEDEPYRKVPQLAINGFWPGAALGLELGIESEFAYFDRKTGVTGLRSHLLPEVARPVQIGPLLVEPYAALDYTTYDLGNVDPGGDESPSRTVPIYSLDMRTLLERVWGDGGKWLQTVEPRVQFVHVPFEDQSALPVFDTIEPDFNLVQLFRRNRYVGLDRLSDTDQLNLGVTTRLIRSKDGSQFLTATIGETQYFSSRDVVLPGELPSDDGASDYIAELGMNVNNQWNVDLGYQWDSDENVTQLAEARVLYRADDFRILNLSYRFRRDSIEEVDVAGAWPLGDRWSVVGRFDYSIQDSEPLERFVGLEYSTCCWGVRLVARRYLTSRDGESDSSVTLQLLLKGFGSSGSPAERLLDRGILGYDRFDQY